MSSIKPKTVGIALIFFVVLFVVCPPLISSNSWELFGLGVLLLLAIIWVAGKQFHSFYKRIWSSEDD